MGSKPQLAYWDIRGLAEPIRLLLAYCKVDFEDKHYVCGEAPDYDKSCWFDIKNTLGLPFPNLPYYIDGDIKVVQSNAILRYIGEKNNLCGSTDKEKVNVAIMENQAMDFRNGFVRLCYGRNNYEGNKETYLKETLPKTLAAFSNFLGDNQWFAGEKVTIVDFPMYELFSQHKEMSATCLDKHENLKKFMDRFESLPEIKEYFSSPSYKKLPLNNRMALFGSTA